MNEEEVKAKIVLPLLQSLGIYSENLSLEKSFYIRLGRFHETIKEDVHRPRLDILVKVDEENLFVIEVKIEEHEITQDDIEQALCYARLVMPPLAIVTNGKAWRIFDSFDGTEITNIPESRYVGEGYSLQFNDELRDQALEKLLTMNHVNFSRFCDYQILEALDPLTNAHKNRKPKFISEVYVERESISNAFQNFVESNSTCFLITGPSGIGKTTTFCKLARDAGKSHLCLFYNSSLLTQRLEECLAKDFNCEFSTHKTPEQYIKQLQRILESNKKDLILFIDAIDEWKKLSNAELELNEFINRIKDKRIKLVLSCKYS